MKERAPVVSYFVLFFLTWHSLFEAVFTTNASAIPLALTEAAQTDTSANTTALAGPIPLPLTQTTQTNISSSSDPIPLPLTQTGQTDYPQNTAPTYNLPLPLALSYCSSSDSDDDDTFSSDSDEAFLEGTISAATSTGDSDPLFCVALADDTFALTAVFTNQSSYDISIAMVFAVYKNELGADGKVKSTRIGVLKPNDSHPGLRSPKSGTFLLKPGETTTLKISESKDWLKRRSDKIYKDLGFTDPSKQGVEIKAQAFYPDLGKATDKQKSLIETDPITKTLKFKIVDK